MWDIIKFRLLGLRRPSRSFCMAMNIYKHHCKDRLLRHLMCLASGMLLAGAAHAETPPTPGAVRESLSAVRPVLPATPAQVLLPDQAESPVHDRNGKRFQVHSFRFAGATAFTGMQLKRVVERFVDLELNLYELNRAADAVTEFYHDRGYLLAKAIIPAQRVDDGVVTLAVIEGRVGGVLVSGNKSYASGFLQERIGNLKPGSLMETSYLERNLLLLNDLPGLTVRATLSPGAEFGTSDVLIKVDERRFGGSMTLDNTGRAETGSKRVDLTGEINNPLGNGDQLKLRATVTEHSLTTLASMGYSIPIGGEGWRLAANYSDVKYDLAGTFAALGIQGSARTADLALSWPLTRSRSQNETLTLTARGTRLVQNAMAVETSNVMVPMLNFSYMANWIGHDASVSNLAAQIASNLRKNADGKSLNAVRYRAELDGNYLLPLNRYWDFYFRGAVAYSPDRLPDSEKYSIGGPGSVRAYRLSELRGDSGWQTTLEFRRTLRLGSVPGSVAMFGDMGRAIYKAPGYSDSFETIKAWGVGLSAYPFKKTTVKLELARAGSGNYSAGDGKKNRLWASVNTGF